MKEVESKNDVPVIYNTISAFVDFLNLINAFGPDNYMKPEEDDVKMEEEERENKDTKMESDVSEEEKKKQNAKVPLQRSIFVNANMLKTIFSLDDKNTNEHPLTKLEKLIEVMLLLTRLLWSLLIPSTFVHFSFVFIRNW